MVLLNVKVSESDSFLFRAPVSAEMNPTTTAVVRLHNSRVRLRYVQVLARDLLKHVSDSAVRTSFSQTLDEAATILSGRIPSSFSVASEQAPAGLPCPAAGEVVPLSVVDEAYRRIVAAMRIAFTRDVSTLGDTPEQWGKSAQELDAADADKLVASVPAGEGGAGEMDGETRRTFLKTCLAVLQADDVASTPAARETFDEETTVLWFAAKQLLRERRLGDLVGRNETMKIVVKMARAGAGMPAREQAVDSETQKAMMAYYFKKQEDQKRLEADEELGYANQPWADPRGLKDHFQGVGSIRYR
eukprot:TRINITY_DN70156_c0_g1_i1.p1 TRINITY_DN70156_c0_g1~~TRINITY_DN70156_c0_g1_i1.p1  ORF type:complete len:302 (+),score=58.85 TRINITY_DN70156_c0_g1_i1:78-983(+)